MGKKSKLDRELLSAFLDDALSDSERQQVQSLLVSDAVAARYLDEMRATRECLKTLATDSLQSSIAARVISRAQTIALSEGLPANHPVMLSMGSSANVSDAITAGQSGHLIPSERVNTRSGSAIIVRDRIATNANRLMWSGLAVLAASILCAALLPFFRNSAPENLISQVAPELSIDNGSSVAAPDVEVSPFESTLAASPVPSPDVSPRSPAERPPSGVLDTMNGSDAADSLKLDLEIAAPAFDFLLMCEAVLTQEGWKAGRFDALLDELGVSIAGTILVEPEMMTVLEESKVIGVNTGEPASKRSGTALVFVQGNVGVLDQLIVAMESDRISFSEFSYNLAIDEKKVLLAKLLRKQAGRRNSPQASARFLVTSERPTASGQILPPFSSPKREKADYPVDKALLKQSSAGMQLGGDGNGEMLIVLREASE